MDQHKDVGPTSILVRSRSSALAILNERKRQGLKYYRFIPCIAKINFWHLLVDVFLICCFVGQTATLYALAEQPDPEDLDDSTWQFITIGGLPLLFDSCGSICYYIFSSVYTVTILMALVLGVIFWHSKSPRLYTQYSNKLLGIILITTPMVQYAYITATYFEAGSVVRNVFSFMDDFGFNCLYLAIFLRQYQLYRIVCTQKRTNGIQVSVRFMALCFACLALALTIILMCEFTDICPLLAFDIYYFVPGITLVVAAAFCCYKMWTISYVFRDQHAVMRVLAFEVFSTVVYLSQLLTSTIGREIVYFSNSLLGVWIIAAETRGSYVVNLIYTHYKKFPLFEEGAILTDVYTILDGSTGVEQLLMDEDLQGILLKCAGAQYCDELVQFLADLCKVMPNFKHTESTPVGAMLDIVDKYVKTKQPTSLNIESGLRAKVLACAEEMEEVLRNSLLTETKPPYQPNTPSINDCMKLRGIRPGTEHAGDQSSQAKKVADSHAESSIDFSQGRVLKKHSDGPKDVPAVDLESSSVSILPTVNSSKALYSAHDMPTQKVDDRDSVTKKMSDTAEYLNTESIAVDVLRNNNINIAAMKGSSTKCRKDVALGMALEETAESVCVLLKFSGVVQATEKDPEFLEITQKRMLLAKNNVVQVRMD